MGGNTIGRIFRVTTFGESHGAGIGGVIDGVPAGISFDERKVECALKRRRGGGGVSSTERVEEDKAEFLSGIFNGFTTGAPIAFLIRNGAQKSNDYDDIKDVFRPSHADYSYFAKYGIRDYRGGGRASGRETACRVVSGAVAQMILDTQGVSITAYTQRAAGISISKVDYSQIEENEMRAPDTAASKRMVERIKELREKGDSAGGIVCCVVRGVPAGWGEPVFDKLDAALSCAMLSIGAVKAIEFGAGFAFADMTGSVSNDGMYIDDKGAVRQKTHNVGGILGGISCGDDIFFRLAIKPVPSISKAQHTVKIKSKDCTGRALYEETDISIHGRHDACLCPRIVPVVEAMCAITLADMYLRAKSDKL